jgi:hypothetical protein
MHAPIAMLDHLHMISPKDLDMIQPNDDNDDNEIDPVPLLCSSYERFLQSRNLLIDAWNSSSGDGVEGSMLKRCKNLDYRSIHRFCEAVRVDMENSKEKSPAGTISNTLGLITVIFEDVVKAVNIHNRLINSDDPQGPWPDVILMNRTETFGGFAFEGGIIKNEEYSPLQKELLNLLEGLCIFGYREYYKSLVYTLVEAHKIIYGTGTPDQKKLMEMLHLSTQEMIAHMMRQGRSIPSVF